MGLLSLSSETRSSRRPLLPPARFLAATTEGFQAAPPHGAVLPWCPAASPSSLGPSAARVFCGGGLWVGGPGRAGLLTVPASFSPLTGCPGQRRPTRPRRPSGKCLSPVAGSPGAGGRRNAFPVFPSMSVMSFEAVARLSQPRFRHFFEEGPIGRRKNHLLLTVCIVRYFAWGSQTQGHWPWGQFPSRDPEAQGMQSQISTGWGGV